MLAAQRKKYGEGGQAEPVSYPLKALGEVPGAIPRVIVEEFMREGDASEQSSRENDEELEDERNSLVGRKRRRRCVRRLGMRRPPIARFAGERNEEVTRKVPYYTLQRRFQLRFALSISSALAFSGSLSLLKTSISLFSASNYKISCSFGSFRSSSLLSLFRPLREW